jgi:hypothetical protein
MWDTWFQILVISPSDWVSRAQKAIGYTNDHGINSEYDLIECLFNALESEQEVLQAYSLLDVPMQSVYAKTLTWKGRKEDARRVHEDIVRTIEKKYGNQLGRWYRPQSFSMPGEEFFPYLESLSALGRNKDSDRLRKAHASGSII